MLESELLMLGIEPVLLAPSISPEWRILEVRFRQSEIALLSKLICTPQLQLKRMEYASFRTRPVAEFHKVIFQGNSSIPSTVKVLEARRVQLIGFEKPTKIIEGSSCPGPTTQSVVLAIGKIQLTR